MRWIVKIKNNKNIRILIRYQPLDDIIYFIGECKINGNWVEFSSNFIQSEGVDLDKIKELFEKSYNELIKRHKIFVDLNKGLGIISEVDFGDVDDENVVKFK